MVKYILLFVAFFFLPFCDAKEKYGSDEKIGTNTVVFTVQPSEHSYLKMPLRSDIKLKTVIINNHEYIITISSSYISGYSCGPITYASTIHSESCKCKQKQK